MANFRTVMVIGEPHSDIIAKYSASTTKGSETVKYKITEAPKLHKLHLNVLETIIKTLQDNVNVPRRQEQLDEYKGQYQQCLDMDDFEFYEFLTENYEHDTDGNAITDENPNAYYEQECCFDDRIKKNQNDEAPFVDPFILKDGTKAYSAKVCDIDWNIMHLGKSAIYEAVWEICVEGRDPKTNDEETAKQVMSNKHDYFAMFNSKKEYVYHCSAFWTYGVATNDNYIECNGRDINWTNDFYDTYVKPLPNDTLLTLYQVKLID